MLYYSHVNEDNCVERKLLQQENYPTAITIAGSGERVLALMDIDCLKKIIAIDLNKEALFLLQLKITAITQFTTEEYFKFIGHHYEEQKNRIKYFEKIKNELNPECKLYWEKNISIIGNGILNSGHFELFLKRVRPALNFFLGDKFQYIFKNKKFESNYFPKRRWKLITYFFSQKWIYHFLGNKDLAFVSIDARNKRIPDALDAIIREGKTNSCFMMHLIFKGSLQEMDEEQLPPSLQKKVIDKIRKRLLVKEITIEYWNGDLLELIKTNSSKIATPVFYSASDILSFVSLQYLEELIEYCTKSPNNTILFRSFLRNIITKKEIKILSGKKRGIKQFDEEESTKMYQVFAIKSAIDK